MLPNQEKVVIKIKSKHIKRQHNNSFLHFISRNQLATGIAILFHVIGFIGIVYFDRDFFTRATPVNLLLMFALLLFTQKKLNAGMLIFTATCIITGIVAEIIGTKTGWLFGDYTYGTVLGPVISEVPLIIGVNWFIVIYCAGISISSLLNAILDRIAFEMKTPKPSLRALSVIVDGATLAFLFDFLMEPVAIKLGYWSWGGDGEIPFYNYLCWFILSALLLTLFHFSKFDKNNKFAVNLLLIQAMFFLLLRTFL